MPVHRFIADFMWLQACNALAQAEAERRRFLVPRAAGARQPAWEAPADIYESDTELVMVVALPGVAAADIGVAVGDGVVVVTGERRLALPQHSALLRLEIPHGHFERRLPLPATDLRLDEHRLVDGCLRLTFRKLG